MKIKEIIHELENWAPPALQESYDNSGLIIGNKDDEFTGAIICLDSTEAVVQEAIDKGCPDNHNPNTPPTIANGILVITIAQILIER